MQKVMNRFKTLLERKNITQPDTTHMHKIKSFENTLECRGLNFHFNGRRHVKTISNFNLVIHKGDTIALVGKSGSGKSTLAKLLTGIYKPKGGEILMDGFNIGNVNMSRWRQLISYVGQDTFLFKGSLKENLLIGNLRATGLQLDDAIEKANLTDFIKTLPLKLNTPVGENGVMLSGGQRQRLSIARSFLKDAPILILDEATSSLDYESEAAIQNSLERLMKNRTIILIAHRLSTVQQANRIVVLDQGQIVEEGTHTQLLKNNGFYRQLFFNSNKQPSKVTTQLNTLFQLTIVVTFIVGYFLWIRGSELKIRCIRFIVCRF